LDSNRQRLPLDALELKLMASGHVCLNLSERVSWEEFPGYANELLALLNGSTVSVTEGPDIRLWRVLVEHTELRLVYEDFPEMVSLESDSDLGDRLLQLLAAKLRPARTHLG
jgi:hypothetical protein